MNSNVGTLLNGEIKETGSVILDIMQALELMNSFSEKDNFNREDLIEIRKTTFNIHKLVTMLAYKVGNLEKQNYTLSQNFKDNDSKLEARLFPPLPNKNRDNDNITKTDSIGLNKTYSTITKSNKDEREGEKWVTPPQRKKHEMLVKLKDQTGDTKKVLKEIKKNVTEKGESIGTFKNVRQVQNGGVLIECQSESQLRNLQLTLNKYDELQIKEIKNTNPMLMITGIAKGYDSKTFTSELISDNPTMKVAFGEEVGCKIKFIIKKECRNKNRENWILQTHPEIFKWLIKNETLCFDLTRVYVTEYTDLPVCYRCCLGDIVKEKYVAIGMVRNTMVVNVPLTHNWIVLTVND